MFRKRSIGEDGRDPYLTSVPLHNLHSPQDQREGPVMMRSIRKHATSWFSSRHFGSNEHLDIPPTETPVAVRRSNTKTEFELTSLRTKQLLEKGKFQKVVEMLRELSRDFLLKCLESFPFKSLNNSIPESFPVWETLLTKLHNNEDGYIPQFPYAACDKLVLQIGRLLESIDESSRENADLVHACKRVLKKVYMQYNGVLLPLYKEHERIERAIYSLSLHLPLGTDLTAVPLHVAVKAEVEGCLTDYQDAIERFEELAQKESLSLSQVLYDKQGGRENGMEMVEFHAPNPNQIQLQERLYFNQCIMRALQPKSRQDNLSQLLELLSKRILGDKEVIALFGNIRMRNESISNTEPVEPWLRKHQKAVECSIAVLKEIEKELEINIPRTVSPTETGCSELSSSLEDPEIVPVPMLSRKGILSDEQVHVKPSALRRGSVVPVLFNIGEGEGEDDEIQKQERRYSSPPQHRSRSTSPNKFRQTSGMNLTNGIQRNLTVDGSLKSLDSSRSSCRSLNGRRAASSSIHDLNSTAERLPTLAFTRVQSLKASANHTIASTAAPSSRTLVAGRRKSEAHLNTLSTSTGTVDKPSKLKRLFRSGSGGLVSRWDTQQRDEGVGTNLLWELEIKTKQLQKSQEMILELQRRERELTDRLSEQAQRQLLDSEKFEDILLGASRPTIVIQRYEELYSQARLEALDAIEGVQIKKNHQVVGTVTAAMDASDMLNVQLMLDVFKFAYKAAWDHLQQLHCSWKQLLGVQTDIGEEEEEESCCQMAEKQLESSITVYLRRVSPFQDLSQVVKLLMSQLDIKFSRQPFYKKIKTLAPFISYVEECVRVAWGLCIQTPPMTINCESTVYNPDLHKRFYNADKSSTDIIVYMWPVLMQTSGPVLVRGVVLT